MVRCAVATCKNSNDRKGSPFKKFVRFPDNEKLRNTWLKLCGYNKKPTKGTRVCSDHFEDDILHSLKCRLMGTNKEGKRCVCTLPATEIPTLKLPETVEVLKVLNKYTMKKSNQDSVEARKQIVEQLLNAPDYEIEYRPKLSRTRVANARPDVEEQQDAGILTVAYMDQQDTEETIMIRIPEASEEFITIKEEPLLEIPDPGDIEIYEFPEEEIVMEDFCRMCALSKDSMVSVFGEEGTNMQLQHKINYCLPIKVGEGDLLPLVVCRPCIAQLEKIYKVAQSCLQADETLRDMYMKRHGAVLTQEEPPLPALTSIEPSQIPQTTQEFNVPVVAKVTVPSKLSFQFVKSIPSNRLPTMCRICNLLLCTVPNAKQHYENVHCKVCCSFCFEIFDTNDQLVDHTNQSHVFNCSLCNFKVVGVGENLLKNHITKTHIKPAPKKSLKIIRKTPALSTKSFSIQCKICFTIFNSKTVIRQHYLTNHRKHICTYCWTDFPTEKKLDAHVTTLCHEVICKICMTECSTPRGLQQHMSLAHQEGGGSFDCQICSGVYQSKSNIRKHYVKYHSVYPCLTCDSFFKTEPELTEHCKKETHMECDRCRMSFDVWDDYVKHQESHQTRKCHLCNKSFTANCNLQCHLRYVHEKKPYRYGCTQCNSKFKNPQKLRMHMARHSNTKNIRCDICDKSFYDENALKTHMSCHSEERKYVCDKCGAKFKHHRNLSAHVGSVHLSWEYMCALCNKSFSSEPDVVIHFNEHSDEEKLGFVGKPFLKASPFHCEICDKYFASKLYQSLHMKRHHASGSKAIQQFQCDVCNKTFSSKHYMLSHFSLKHNNVKNYQCDTCKKQFMSITRLKIHLQSHDKTKVYSCVHCQKVFPRNQNLALHLRNVHYKIKKYKCGECSKTFGQISHLKQHRVVHTNERPFPCDLCPQKFTQVGDMRRHRAKHLSVTEVNPEQGSTYELILLTTD